MYEPDSDPRSLTLYAEEKECGTASELMDFLGGYQFRQDQWIFRGQPDADMPLQTTLERFAAEVVDAPNPVERYIDRAFRRHAHHYTSDLPDAADSLEWLALMRHHGAPSRLLDFSKSPYVAAFFATADARRDKSAAIWAVEARAIGQSAGRLLAKGSMGVNVSQHGKQCSVNAGYFSRDPKAFVGVFEGGALAEHGAVPARVVVPLEPSRTNERVRLQEGIFLAPVTLFARFEHAMKNVVREVKEAIGGPEVLYKISIPPGVHPNVLRELHRMNITYATLFPGLDGLVRSLATVCKIRTTSVPPGLPPDYNFDWKL